MCPLADTKFDLTDAEDARASDYLTMVPNTRETPSTLTRLGQEGGASKKPAKTPAQMGPQRDQLQLLGNSAPMMAVRRFIGSVAPVDCKVLLHGESGTGKGVVARQIHLNSSRAKHPFVVADCSALAPSVMESELFGHVKGSFTSAHTDRKGYFETADMGTIFLDEIGELPLELQGKLLRVVEDHLVTKLGSAQGKKVDVRIIAATNRNLEEMVRQGTFRRDLFHRLNVIQITLPHLRKRREDIPLLIEHFLQHYAAKLGMDVIPAGARTALEARKEYDWPGNVRELENETQRALILGDKLDLSEATASATRPKRSNVIQVKVSLAGSGDYQQLQQEVLSKFCKQFFDFMLSEHQGNITSIAQTIGMRRTSVQRLVKRHGLDPRYYRQQAL